MCVVGAFGYLIGAVFGSSVVAVFINILKKKKYSNDKLLFCKFVIISMYNGCSLSFNLSVFVTEFISSVLNDCKNSLHNLSISVLYL